METPGLCGFLYYCSLCVFCVNAAFTEVPKDVSVGEGEDVEMPCAFKAVSSAPMSLEIQWWYLKEDMPKDVPHELQISAPANRAKVAPREATKISTVRVQGNAISHRLSLSKVKKEDEGVYECRVSDLWADETQEFTVHAALRVMPGDGMVAEEAVSHIQNRWPLRNANTALGAGAAGRATSEPSQGLAGGPRLGQGKQRVHQPGLLPSISSTTTTSVAKSSASPLPGNAAILRQQHGAGCSVMSTMDPLLCITLLFLHKLLPFLLAH
ncbi:V-set and transmembrane domain-containing protein 2B [Seriola lalandi dorsalis]|uniref:V-set and transmembrane domain-containing protein 2B n=1 Tax=Seriola lalandi dorsalis TaxID=1841481 RepID=A0A3B4Y2H2_SERLL|nr:V-set and transmembrane domain-containing protein 2B [Seriola lalandi dorsalis]XP_056240289.1 V-set and transmembrane domain-containing protein 2B [Seriola aureovittata]